MLIGVVGYKGGIGKTTISNFVADRLQQEGQTIILNLDYYQKFREITQKIPTVSLEIDDSIIVNEIYKKGVKNIIIDTGGFDDKRILELANEFDSLIFPTKSDIGDLRMLGDTINTILSYRTTPMKIIICISDYYDKEELKECQKDINTLILPLIDSKFNVEVVAFAHSKTVKRVNKEKKTLTQLDNDFKAKQTHKSSFSPYKAILEKIDLIIKAIKE